MGWAGGTVKWQLRIGKMVNLSLVRYWWVWRAKRFFWGFWGSPNRANKQLFWQFGIPIYIVLCGRLALVFISRWATPK